MPRFSVVVPAYNAQDTLAETLDALLLQTVAGWECIVVDDGSEDSTNRIAGSYAQRDARFRVITQENRGTGGAYNTGVSAATGEWVTICSADDVLLPAHLESMGKAIDEHPSVDIFTCNGYFWWPDGTRTLVYTEPQDREPRSWSLEDLFEKCFFSVGACYRRTLFDKVGGYKDAFGEDYDFWLRAMAAGAQHLYVPVALALHRRSLTQKSAARGRAYESDIRSISEVVKARSLTPAQAKAADAGIRLRRALLAEENSTGPTALFWRARRWVGSRLHRRRAPQ